MHAREPQRSVRREPKDRKARTGDQEPRAGPDQRRRAVEAGARPDSVEIIELEDAALTYLASDALRVRARAVGELEAAEG